MSKIFYRKQFSDYLGENRAILDIVNGYAADPTPSPSPTPPATPTPTPSSTITPTPTYTPTPTPSATPGFDFCIGNGLDDYSYSVVGDGSNIIVGGLFNYYKDYFSPAVVRINKTTGSVDNSFVSPYSYPTQIYVVKPSSYFSGKYYVGGVNLTGVFTPTLQRLNSDGTVDTTFSGITNMISSVSDLVELSDGSVIAVGAFQTVNGLNRNRICKFNTDGSVNTTFAVGTGFNNIAYNVRLSADETSIFVGGAFTQYSGITTTRLVKIDSTTGVLNNQFAPSTFNSAPIGLAFDGSNNLWAVGNFAPYPGGTGTSNFICALETTSGTTVSGIDFGNGFEDSPYGIKYDSINDRMIITTQSIPTTDNANKYKGITFYGRILSVLPNGDLDTSFGSTGSTTYGFNKEAPGQSLYDNDLFIDSNADIYVGGTFTSFSGNRFDRLIKLDDTGQSITRTNC